MMGHPHSYGWRAAMRHEARRRYRKALFVVAGLFTLGALVVDGVARGLGAW